MPEAGAMAADIAAVERMGADAWMGLKRLWPVSEEEFHALAAFLAEAWRGACLGLDGPEGEVMLCDNANGWLTQLAHRAVAAGRMGGGAAAQPGWEALAEQYGRVLDAGKGRLGLRRLARNLAFNGHLPLPARLGRLAAPNAVALGSNDPLRDVYVRRSGLGVDNTYIGLLAGGARAEALPGHVEEALDAFAREAERGLAERFGTGLDALPMAATLKARTATLMAVYRAVRRRARAVPLLVTEAARPLHKAAACGWRAGGGRALGFHHGQSVGELRRPDQAYYEFFAYDEFVCASESGRRGSVEDWSSSPLAGRRDLAFSLCRDESGAGAPRTRDRAAFPGRVRRVMLMGYPMRSHRFAGATGLFWATQLELEVRLARMLRAEGLEVLYKVHPEQLQPAARIMEGEGCRVVPQPLEQVVDMADAFVVKYPQTSTFISVLRSDRPVYFIDLEDGAWRGEHRRSLGRRCVALPGEVGADGRVAFDQDALVRGLCGEQQYPDYGYVDDFHGPTG